MQGVKGHAICQGPRASADSIWEAAGMYSVAPIWTGVAAGESTLASILRLCCLVISLLCVFNDDTCVLRNKGAWKGWGNGSVGKVPGMQA